MSLLGCMDGEPHQARACDSPDVMQLDAAGRHDVDAADASPMDETEDAPILGGPFSIDLESFHITVAAGERVLIPIAVRRILGFDAPVILTADGLPDSIYAEPTVEVPERAGTVLVIEAAGDAPLVRDAPFVISGRAEGHRRSLRVTIDVVEGDATW